MEYSGGKFGGFEPNRSNFTPTFNQYYDVVVAQADSVYEARLIGWAIRKYKPWRDADNILRGSEMALTYADAQREAGIPSPHLKKAFATVVAKRYVECVAPGRPSQRGDSGSPALYRLLFDLRPDFKGKYLTDPEDFHGFCARVGNLTWTPDEFFTCVLPSEELSTIKVVACVFRNTEGWQDEFGARRPEIAMSRVDISRRMHISLGAVDRGLKRALEAGFLRVVTEGTFDPKGGATSKAAVYAVKYREDAEHLPKKIGSLPTKRDRPHLPNGTGHPPTKQDRKDLPNSIGPTYETVSVTHVPNEIDIKSTNKSSVKQQQKASSLSQVPDLYEADPVVAVLSTVKIDSETAKALAGSHDIARIKHVVAWVNTKPGIQNPAGMVRRALEGNWICEMPNQPDPEEKRKHKEESERRKEEAAYVAKQKALYAAYLSEEERRLEEDYPDLYRELLTAAEKALPPFLQKQRGEGKGNDVSEMLARRKREELLPEFCGQVGVQVMAFEDWVAHQPEWRNGSPLPHSCSQ